MSGRVPRRGCRIVREGARIVRYCAFVRQTAHLFKLCVRANLFTILFTTQYDKKHLCIFRSGIRNLQPQGDGTSLRIMFSINRHCNSRPKHYLQEHIKTITAQFYKLILLIDHSMLTVERNKETDHHR